MRQAWTRRPGRRLTLAASIASLALVEGAPVAAAAVTSLPRLMSAELGAVSLNAQSGGIAACDVTLDATGSVRAVALVQDMAPFGEVLARSLPGWRFEPAREGGQAVSSRVLVLWVARPPATSFAAPGPPRYKGTVAPPALPWPTSAIFPPYPPNALGSGYVVLESDISEDGQVTATRRLSSPTAFDGAADGAVRQWRFRAAEDATRPVASRAVVVFSFVGTTR